MSQTYHEHGTKTYATNDLESLELTMYLLVHSLSKAIETEESYLKNLKELDLVSDL